MAKRRKISAPSADDLSRIEEEFRRETPARPNAALAPISQVSAEAAAAQPVVDAATRAEQEQQRADAAALDAAKGEGRLIEMIPLDDILADAMVRDRTVIDPDEMSELKASIAAHGLRLPIEVFRRTEGDQPYGLLSGYRRLWAVRELLALTGDAKYKSIKALVRDPEVLGGSFAAMVEENEVRASLSHYERGRIAVVAAQQGAFANTEEAVAQLFNVASKAKRSKIRSFSLIFEELGDLLEFPENLKERDGLRLSTALRNGAEPELRDALAKTEPASAEAEWACMLPVIEAFELTGTSGTRGGRPKKQPPKLGWSGRDTLHLSSGVTLQSGTDSQGYVIRLKGRGVDSALVERAMEHLQYLFEKG
ncbi:ParB/RepB/Spo0J family partition protein [Roseobacter sinensis]|uniref:ParB N-terminal domain-containing protein n=1 Tax=Roseobacter sinensis TaxID=2931391 RepID=A0ABT3BK41_9RHOB|nr:ParB N-terminal domain-containing protein [Roseobacter sp. WL0113]MCV3273948.1 ParB N-terminal domain-containing protein [Roseobacter sp. WL0113]